MNKARIVVLTNAVLPQDLWAGPELAGSPRWLASRRFEQRLVGRFVALGLFGGGVVSVLTQSAVLDVMAIGVVVGLAVGLVGVAWRRGRAAP